MTQAVLAGGCFWCLEPVFASPRGVTEVLPGYAGGHVPDPTYEQVCTGKTGHAESIRVTFDPSEVSYRDLLEVFFAVHDPTTKDRQGHDVGPQYRSAIFYADESQRQDATEAIEGLSPDPAWEGTRVLTELNPLQEFYPAEGYHRDYFRRNPAQGYCQVVIAPKVAKFQKRFAGRLVLPDRL